MATVEEVAEACNLTRQRIAQLVTEGVLTRQNRGVYDLAACTRAYIRHLQAAVSSKGVMTDDGAIVTTKNAKAELTRVQTEIKKLELAKARGEVIGLDDHESVLSTLIIETKARVMAIAPRVAPKILGMDSRLMVQAMIEAEAKLALAELAQRTPMLPRADDATAPAKAPTKALTKGKRPRRTKVAKPPAKRTKRTRATAAGRAAP